MSRRIAAVTVGRSDFGILLPVLKRIRDTDGLELTLIVSGMHLHAAFGDTIEDVRASGLPIGHEVPLPLEGDAPRDVAAVIAAAVAGFGDCYARERPDLLMVLGDRYEAFGAVAAALPFRIPVAHIHGGELTLGAMDDALRHSMTKMSHLHFVATEDYARRVRQLGEEDWRITVSGAPALDNLTEISLPSPEDLTETIGLDLSQPTLLVTFHPVTLEYENTEEQIGALLDAVRRSGLQAVFTQPNADTAHRTIVDAVSGFVGEQGARARLVENLGTAAYFGLMQAATAMVGNSSSGLIEAPSFGLPVVNIGNRQKGRVRGTNVIDTAPDTGAILDGIMRATSASFRDSLKARENPYGNGGAAAVIVERLLAAPGGETLIAKGFVDRNAVPSPAAGAAG